MLDNASPDRRSRQRNATRHEIVAAAWELTRRDGLAALSLRELGAAVGMRAPSLYSYFDSKDAIYDAMFRQGQAELGAIVDPIVRRRPLTCDDLRAATHAWFDFCVADPVRYQLLFQRVIPGFEPSPGSYALAIERLDEMIAGLRRLGVDDPAQHDLYTGLISGLVSQQLANDPDGSRWRRVLDEAIDMYLHHTGAHDEGATP